MIRRIAIVAGIIAIITAVYLFRVAGRGAMDFAGGITVPLAEYRGTSPTGVPSALAHAGLVARGEYLARAADCSACHTVKGGQPFAGGFAFRLPYGTLYSPNITPDAETGIGQWSDADFLRAVHEGISPGGSRYYPAFPYPSYSYLADADVLAIKAYLFSLPPAHAPRVPDTFRFPYNQRWTMKFWSALFRPGGRFEPHEDMSPAWNRGAYLVEGLAHCGDCHTPRSLLQGLDQRRKFAGAVITGWHAYNITADKESGIGAWSDDELARYLSTGHAAGRGTASGPMSEAVELSFSHLARDDIDAIVTYVRSVPAIANEASPPKQGAPAPASHLAGVPDGIDPLGKYIFEGACASCHGWTGESPVTPQASLVGTRAVNDPSGINVVQIILSGEEHGGSAHLAHMPSFGRSYSDTEIAAVANYVIARFGGRSSSLTAGDVARLRQ